MSKARPFTKEDWYGYGGAVGFATPPESVIATPDEPVIREMEHGDLVAGGEAVQFCLYDGSVYHIGDSRLATQADAIRFLDGFPEDLNHGHAALLNAERIVEPMFEAKEEA